MKALILAGGFGTRLRPLSCTRPKLMFPIVNRELLDWTLENLSKSGVDRVILAVNHMAEALERSFRYSRHGMEIVYSRESRPLGTGGPIKNAEGFLIEDGEPFFVLNGDVFSDVDYGKLYKFHEDSGATVTIALYEVEDPSRFGVVELNEKGQVMRFIEKPKPEEAPSKLVNAGVYVLNPSILKSIPDGRKVSTEIDVFPGLAHEGSLYGYRFDGFWVDIGVPEDFFLANRMMLDRLAADKPLVEKNVAVHETAMIIAPSAVGEASKVAEDAAIGPYAVVGRDVEVGKGSRIDGSIIFQDTIVEGFASIRGAIVGEGAIIGRWVKVEEGCIIGDHAIIHDNVTLTKNVEICPFREVSSSVLEPGKVM